MKLSASLSLSPLSLPLHPTSLLRLRGQPSVTPLTSSSSLRRLRLTTVAASTPYDASGPARFKHEPKTIYAEEGERFLFQFGEGLTAYEVPKGTRVIYPGVRRDGEKDLAKIEAMIRNAFDNPLGTEPLRTKLRKLKASKPNPKIVSLIKNLSAPFFLPFCYICYI